MFRYPLQPDCSSNFDSGTGVFLFNWLYRSGAIAEGQGTPIRIGLEATIGAIGDLVREIESIESISDNDSYVAAAVEFVTAAMPDRLAGGAGPSDAFSRLVPMETLLMTRASSGAREGIGHGQFAR